MRLLWLLTLAACGSSGLEPELMAKYEAFAEEFS